MEQRENKHYKFYVSSWHCRTDTANAVGVVEQDTTITPDGERIVKNQLKIYPDPIRPFWVTKPECRSYEYKKEFELLANCEEYRCHDSELEETMAKALGVYMGMRKRTVRQLCTSPYIYGADIPTETLIKQNYLRSVPAGMMATITRGGLDIESEVRGEKRINIITFIHEHEIYTAALEEYCKVYPDPDDKENFRMATEQECVDKIREMLGSYLLQYKFRLTFKICHTELDLIKWIFQQIHRCKTSYIGVWNLGFDLPMIFNRLEKLGANPADVMCHPEVPKQYQIAKFLEDQKKADHYTDKWHWTTISGYSQFVDSMCLYARLRKVYGRDTSYSLDYISTKELGQGKLHFGEITNHWYMQNFRFLEYIAYNVNDVMIMQLMEWKNNDIVALTGQCGKSLASQFSRQTVMLRDDSFEYAYAQGRIPASTGNTMFTDYDKEQPKAGGTVLPPNKAVGVSAPVVAEMPKQRTLVSLFTNDLDFSSLYPTVTSSFNISKETALATILKVDGHPTEAVEHLAAGIIEPHIGAEDVATTFFGLPDYGELDKLFQDWVKRA